MAVECRWSKGDERQQPDITDRSNSASALLVRFAPERQGSTTTAALTSPSSCRSREQRDSTVNGNINKARRGEADGCWDWEVVRSTPGCGCKQSPLEVMIALCNRAFRHKPNSRKYFGIFSLFRRFRTSFVLRTPISEASAEYPI